eukprot:921703_1
MEMKSTSITEQPIILDLSTKLETKTTSTRTGNNVACIIFAIFSLIVSLAISILASQQKQRKENNTLVHIPVTYLTILWILSVVLLFRSKLGHRRKIIALITLSVLFVCTMGLIYKLRLSNPGYQEEKPWNRPRTEWCDKGTCHHWKRPRTHHCSRCNRCVKRYDHHCPAVDNCIGENNVRWFIGLLLSATVYLTYICGIYVYVMCTKYKQNNRQCCKTIKTSKYTLFWGCTVLVIWGLLLVFTVNHLVFVGKNMTTVEAISEDPPNFSRGCALNWHTFLTNMTANNERF